MTKFRIPVTVSLVLLLFMTVSCKSILLKQVAKQYSKNEGVVYPEMQMQDMDGKMVTQDSSAQKVRYVHFWGTWCSPCMNGLRCLNEMAGKMKEYEDIKDAETKEFAAFLEKYAGKPGGVQ